MLAIRTASDSIPAGYRPVTLVTKDGRKIRGVMKSEDAFSIRIMDSQERLQGYLKATLKEVIREEGSLMPDFGPERPRRATNFNDLARARGQTAVKRAIAPAQELIDLADHQAAGSPGTATAPRPQTGYALRSHPQAQPIRAGTLAHAPLPS